MKVAGYLAVFLGGAIICFLLIQLGVVNIVDGISGTDREPELSLPTYLSFVSVMLTAVTVVLAALAIAIGVIAAYTFRELREKAEEAAQKTVNKALSDELITARIDAVAFRSRGMKNLDELEAGFDPTDNGER